MAYDEDLANRLRAELGEEAGVTEKRMFGGLAFLVNGHLAVSASGRGGLLLRVDPADTDALVQRPEARRFEMRGREMDGWLRVAVDEDTPDDAFADWVARGVRHARSLPPKGG
jgi:TfoX N-terminal domain